MRYELSNSIHVGVRQLTIHEWRRLLEAEGFSVAAEHTSPMRLLEPARLLKDEGLFRTLRFAWNVATHAATRERVKTMRRVFRKYNHHLAAIAIVATKPSEEQP